MAAPETAAPGQSELECTDISSTITSRETREILRQSSISNRLETKKYPQRQ